MTSEGLMLWLVAEPPTRDPGLVRSAFWLWIVLAVLGVVLVLGTWVLVSSAKKRAAAAERQRRLPRPILNAWEEAGRRLEAEPKPQVDDDEQGEEDIR